MFHRETNRIATEVKHWRCWTRRLFLGSYCKLYVGICRDPSGKVELVRPRGSFEAAAALICDSLPCFEVGFQEPTFCSCNPLLRLRLGMMTIPNHGPRILTNARGRDN